MASTRAIAVRRAEAMARLRTATATIHDALGIEVSDLTGGAHPSEPVALQQAKQMEVLATLLEQVAERLAVGLLKADTAAAAEKPIRSRRP